MPSPLIRVSLEAGELRSLRVLAARLGRTTPQLTGDLLRLVLDWLETADDAALASMLETGLPTTTKGAQR